VKCTPPLLNKCGTELQPSLSAAHLTFPIISRAQTKYFCHPPIINQHNGRTEPPTTGAASPEDWDLLTGILDLLDTGADSEVWQDGHLTKEGRHELITRVLFMTARQRAQQAPTQALRTSFSKPHPEAGVLSSLTITSVRCYDDHDPIPATCKFKKALNLCSHPLTVGDATDATKANARPTLTQQIHKAAAYLWEDHEHKPLSRHGSEEAEDSHSVGEFIQAVSQEGSTG
jgi:hypothetical protein